MAALALRGFFTARHPYGGAYVYAGVEAEGQGYGFGMHGRDPETLDIMYDVAAKVGRPNILLTA